MDRDNQIFLDRIFEFKGEMEPGLFSYNLGLYNYSKQNYAMSLYYFKRSIKLSLFNPSLEKKALSKIETINQLFFSQKAILDKSMMSNILDFRFYLWEGFSLSLFMILGIFFIVKVLKRKIAYKLIIASFISLFCITVFVMSLYRESLVLKPSVVYRGPSKVYDQIQPVQSPQTLIVYHKNFFGWYRVVFPQNLRGWIEASRIAIF